MHVQTLTKDLIILVGFLNKTRIYPPIKLEVKIGHNARTGWKVNDDIVGHHGEDIINDNFERLIELPAK